MPKIGTVYYLTDAEVEGQMPKATFLGALFSKNAKPDDPRKILSLNKYLGQDESGQHQTAKATKIVFSDGTEEVIADKILTLKFTDFTPKKPAPQPEEFDDKINF